MIKSLHRGVRHISQKVVKPKINTEFIEVSPLFFSILTSYSSAYSLFLAHRGLQFRHTKVFHVINESGKQEYLSIEGGSIETKWPIDIRTPIISFKSVRRSLLTSLKRSVEN